MIKRYDPFEDPLVRQAAVAESQARVFEPLVTETPVFERDADGWVVVGKHADIVAINQHPGMLGTGSAGVGIGGGQKLIPMDLDGPEHRKFRRLLDPLFAPKAKTSQIAGLEPVVRRLANELIDGFAGDGEVDIYQAFCHPLPTIIFVDVMGLPQSDRPFFLAFVDDLLRPTGETGQEQAAVRAAAQARMFAYLEEAVAARRAAPDSYPGLVTGLVQAEVEGARLSDREVLNILFLLMIAGLDTVTATLSCMISWLGRHPRQRQRLVEHPEDVPAAVEELLRFESPVQWIHRSLTEPVALASGATLPAGTRPQIVLAAANLDPDVFPDPLTVDFDRRGNRHIAFSNGPHRCLGSHLARLELRCAIQELNRRIPDYRVTDESRLAYSGGAVRAALTLPLTFTPA